MVLRELRHEGTIFSVTGWLDAIFGPYAAQPDGQTSLLAPCTQQCKSFVETLSKYSSGLC